MARVKQRPRLLKIPLLASPLHHRAPRVREHLHELPVSQQTEQHVGLLQKRLAIDETLLVIIRVFPRVCPRSRKKLAEMSL